MLKGNRTYSIYRRSLRRFGRRRMLVLRAACAIVFVLVLGVIFAFHDTRPGATSDKAASVLANKAIQLPAAKAYGIAAGSSLTGLNDQELDARFRAMSELGMQWVRYDFDWSLIQPERNSGYDWSRYDKIVAASNKYHLQVLGILDYTPAWARVSGCNSSQCAPAKPDQFAVFAAAVTRRYAPHGVKAWEVWNEPNSKDFWKPSASPAAYAALLQKTYTAIKEQDASAYVLTGGLSPQDTNGSSYAPIDFLKALYQNGARPYLDGVADHPYTFPLSPYNSAKHAWTQMAAESLSLRAIMKSNGDGQKKVWITEFGSPTGGPGALSTISEPNLDQYPYRVDEALQAKILSDALALYATYDWAGPFFVYSLQDAGTDPSTNENFFGLLRYDGTPKPAYDAYRQAVHRSTL